MMLLSLHRKAAAAADADDSNQPNLSFDTQSEASKLNPSTTASERFHQQDKGAAAHHHQAPRKRPHQGQQARVHNGQPHRGGGADNAESRHHCNSTSVDSEVFLRNPITGGYDCTPAAAQQRHGHEASFYYTKSHMAALHDDDDDDLGYSEVRLRLRRGGIFEEESTLNDSTIYTSYTRQPLLKNKQQPYCCSRKPTNSRSSSQRRSKRRSGKQQQQHRSPLFLLSPKRLFQTKKSSSRQVLSNPTTRTTTTTYSPPEGRRRPSAPTVTPSPPAKKSLFQQLKCTLASTPSPLKRHKQKANSSNEHKHQNLQGEELLVQDDRNAFPTKAWNVPEHPSLRVLALADTTEPSTPSRNKDSSPTTTPFNNHKSLMDDTTVTDKGDAETCEAAATGPDRLQQQRQRTGPSTADASYAASSSCMDMISYSTFGINTMSMMSYSTDNTKQQRGMSNNSLNWSFDAISPIASCTSPTKMMTVEGEQDASSLDLGLSAILQDAGLDPDDILEDDTNQNDKEEDGHSMALDVFRADEELAASGHSCGALLLTEDGLKRHNDKKLEAGDTIEPLLTSKQTASGESFIGPLESTVLQQKVQRLREKELKQLATLTLEEEEAVRQYRKRRNGYHSDDDDDDDDEDDARSDAALAPPENPTFAKRHSHPPHGEVRYRGQQQHYGMSARKRTPPNNNKQQQSGTTKKKGWTRRLLPFISPTKKPDPEELKRQWKERERQRVQLAKMEKEEEERLERERIQQLKQAYLERQRQLEATAVYDAIEDQHTAVDSNIEVPEEEYIHHHHGNQGGGGINNQIVLSKGGEDRAAPPPRTIVWGGDEGKHQSSTSCVSSTVPTTALGSISTATSKLPPCSICHVRERTHIAMPCMHFSFCETCIEEHCAAAGGDSYSSTCPISSTANVTFSQVHTEV
jgi:hypothetical protein